MTDMTGSPYPHVHARVRLINGDPSYPSCVTKAVLRKVVSPLAVRLILRGTAQGLFEIHSLLIHAVARVRLFGI
jgi:hypothetical protein